MVRSLRHAAVTLFTAMAMSWSIAGTVLAQEATSAIAVVDVQGALRNSNAAKEIQAKINERRQAYQRQVTEEEKALRASEQELQQQRSALAPEVYQQRLRAFRDRVTDVQKSVQERRRALDQAFTNAMNKVRDVLVSVIAEIADERGAKVVLFKDHIVIAEKSLDFSDEALRRLNERLPSVTVDLPPLD
ncbi:OmpH family outer membrane protein [Thalassobaculum sp.]|uniref:OmpH family outer membrane protein n=1 Tax=Thalassobaculum sp. TaxID=2022740 RepID=UPI003B590B81